MHPDPQRTHRPRTNQRTWRVEAQADGVGQLDRPVLVYDELLGLVVGHEAKAVGMVRKACEDLAGRGSCDGGMPGMPGVVGGDGG